MGRKFVLIYAIVAGVPALAGLFIATTGFVGAGTMQDSIGTGGASPWPNVLPSALALLTGGAALVHVHLAAWPREQPSSHIDASSLLLIAIISCLCLLASLWAAFSGADLGTDLNWL